MALCSAALRRIPPPRTYSILPLQCSICYVKCHTRMASSWTLSGVTAKLGIASTTMRPRSKPRTLPSQGFDVVSKDQLIEEEGMAEYKAEHFYPVRLGEVFHSRYQTIAKLGYGSSSTIWLARDLQDHQYVALKICIHNSVHHRELPFYDHLNNILPSGHPGVGNIRKLLGSFETMSLRDMDTVFMKGRGFDEDFVKSAIKELLQAIDFLHTEVQAVHTDIHPGNLLLGSDDNTIFEKVEANEFSNPVARKELPDRTVYFSRLMKPKIGPLLLSDFGEARLGPGPHAGDIMPLMYRAPETLLWIQWSYAVDIWSVGLTAWDLLEGKTLFSARKEDGSFSDGAHFAELIAALGPPPADLLGRHQKRALEYWNEDGTWGGFAPIPKDKSLEAVETKLTHNSSFLHFIRRALTWDPSRRPTAKELLQDPWLVG